jgi:hypothetical protein
VNDTVFPGNNVVVMIFAHVHPVTGKHEEDYSPLGDVALWIEKSQVICRLFHVNIAFAL